MQYARLRVERSRPALGAVRRAIRLARRVDTTRLARFARAERARRAGKGFMTRIIIEQLSYGFSTPLFERLSVCFDAGWTGLVANLIDEWRRKP